MNLHRTVVRRALGALPALFLLSALLPLTAAATSLTPVYAPSGTLVGATVPVTSGTLVTLPGATGIATAGSGVNAIEISFPAGTLLPSTGWTINGGGVTLTNTMVSGTTVRLEFGVALPAGNVTVAVGGGSVTNPPQNGNFTVRTYAAGTTGVLGAGTLTDSGTANLGLIAPTLTTNYTTLPANGSSLATITIATGSGWTAAASTPTFILTNVTTAGSFIAQNNPGGTGTAFFAGTPFLTTYNDFGTAMSTASGVTSAAAVLQAPAAASIAVLNLAVIPTSTSTPAFVTSTSVNFTASAANTLAVTAETPSVIAFNVPSAVQVYPAAGSALTAQLLSAISVPVPGQIVTVTTNLGFLESNGAGSCVSNVSGSVLTDATHAVTNCSAITNASGNVTAYLYGGGVAGVATVHFASGALTANATVSLGGAPVAQVQASQAYKSLALGASATVAFLQPLDAFGNILTGLPLGSFTVTTNTGLFATTPTVGTFVLNTAPTPANGNLYTGYPVAVTCGTTPGLTTIQASLLNTSVIPNVVLATTPITVACAGPAAAFTLTPSATQVAPGGILSVTLAVTDAYGSPVPDTTQVSLFTNGSGSIAPTTSLYTVGGTATFSFLAPSLSSNVVLTGFVTGVSSSKSVTITVGNPAPPAPQYIPAGSATGVTPAGPFDTTTKVVKVGKYVTWQFQLGSAYAGQVVQLYRTVKVDGIWMAWTRFASFRADANGNVTYYFKSKVPAWISVRAIFASNSTLSGAISRGISARYR